jgi:XRE family transcriptional regulator, regulator of sulfur utilization
VVRGTLVKKFGERLRTLRTQQGYSQEKLAGRAKLHRNAIGQIERAEIAATILTIEKLAHALGIEPGDFFPRQGR